MLKAFPASTLRLSKRRREDEGERVNGERDEGTKVKAKNDESVMSGLRQTLRRKAQVKNNEHQSWCCYSSCYKKQTGETIANQEERSILGRQHVMGKEGRERSEMKTHQHTHTHAGKGEGCDEEWREETSTTHCNRPYHADCMTSAILGHH